ncbi:hypothetical protein [Sinisalibacter aestuarii]|uniref:hypothetical protein n=1 Tax=Sinisalibacter aestuarii TaxID=2949426 RepID=UPI002492E156|nr:hypothetical protein [Sinisalibacter aestuarii]
MKGEYQPVRAGIRMRGGQVRSLPVLRHSDEQAEILWVAICDDELIQVVGRGRGVNRIADNPLEVQILADVALPQVYDTIGTWDLERPDLVQRMLLAGVAVDSPTNATTLHPGLFANAEQAKKAFERIGFKGQNPLKTSCREMSLKSARYRRPGRGQSWHRAWWVEGDGRDVRGKLEDALGCLVGWTLEQGG